MHPHPWAIQSQMEHEAEKKEAPEFVPLNERHLDVLACAMAGELQLANADLLPGSGFYL